MSVAYVNEGQTVWAPMPELGGWLRCVVQTAMGDTARVVNEKRGIDTWFHVGDLLSKKPEPR